MNGICLNIGFLHIFHTLLYNIFYIYIQKRLFNKNYESYPFINEYAHYSNLGVYGIFCISMDINWKDYK